MNSENNSNFIFYHSKIPKSNQISNYSNVKYRKFNYIKRCYLNENNNNSENAGNTSNLFSSDDESSSNQRKCSKSAGGVNNKKSFVAQVKSVFAKNGILDMTYATKLHKIINIPTSKSTFYTIIILSCALVRGLALFISSMLLSLMCHTIDFLKRFCRVERVSQIPSNLLPSAFKRLYCFALLNDCRRVNICGILNLPPKIKCKNNEKIFTKCTWPMWVLFGIFLFMIYLSCQYGSPRETPVQKLQVGWEQLKDHFGYLRYSIYNLPGYSCMLMNNCCYNKYVAIKRWLYCIFTLPYRVMFMGMQVDDNDIAIVEELLENLTDWRFKRNLHRIQTVLLKTNRDVLRVRHKTEQFDRNVAKIRLESEKNLSLTEYLIWKYDDVDRLHHDVLKVHEENRNNIQMLLNTKKNIERVSKESLVCTRCNQKKLDNDLEKFVKVELTKLEKQLKKLKVMERRLNDFFVNALLEKHLQPYRDELKKILTEMYTVSNQIEEIEGFKFREKSDESLTRESTISIIDSEMLRHKQANAEFLQKTEKNVLHLDEGIYHYLKQERKTIDTESQVMIMDKSNFIKQCALDFYTKQLKDVIRLSVHGILTLTCTKHKKSGLINIESDENISGDYCQKPFIEEPPYFSNSSKSCWPSSCMNMDVVNARIKTILEIYSADLFGLVDFALPGNGAQILEQYTTTSLYIPIYEFDSLQHLYSISMLNKLMKANPDDKLFNTVFYLNDFRVQPGYCWLFVGNKGSTVMELSEPTIVYMVGLDHIDPKLSHIQNYTDAPREFEVKALSNLDDESDGISMGYFIFEDINKFPIQQFQIEKPIMTRLIKLIIHSNYGAEVTCVYRFRIHGQLGPNK